MAAKSPQTQPDVLSVQLDREDIVLLVLDANERLFRKQTFNGVTRLEKILYLLSKETSFEVIADFYGFKAHNFGPFSKEVYEAVDFLSSCGLIEVRDKSYQSYYAGVGEASLREEIDASSEGDNDDQLTVTATEKLFSLTNDGRKVAQIMRKAVVQRRPTDIEELDRIMIRYANLPLNQLIRYVYGRFPEMTGNSIHPEAERLRDKI
jgi:uncharacterized protein YwgA